jgi:hypothetical protein
MKRVMLRMMHGLGDNVQLTIALKHLAIARPDWQITVETKWPELFNGLCHDIQPLARNFEHTRHKYDEAHYLMWQHCEGSLPNCPSTKPARYLTDLKIEPQADLFRYTINTTAEHEAVATAFIGDRKVALIHYEGVSNPIRKNMSHSQAAQVCAVCERHGLEPILIDPDNTSPLEVERLPKDNVGVLTAVIAKAQVMIGIDSGPEHIAGATATPTLIWWHQWWPSHNYDLADNVTHWYGQESERWIKEPRKVNREYFEGNYVASQSDLSCLPGWLESLGHKGGGKVAKNYLPPAVLAKVEGVQQSVVKVAYRRRGY